MDKAKLGLLKKLVDANGVPGYEGEISDIIASEMKGLTNLSYDKMGCIICEKKGANASPKIMIPGHMDEIGFMTTLITEEGFIKFTALGGWLPQYLVAQRVIIKTTKGNLHGIIGSKPIHLMSDEERKKPTEIKALYIDIGVKDKKGALEAGVKPGDPIIPVGPFTVMADSDYLLAKAWDDRIGCAIFIEVIKALKGRRHPNTVYGVGTVQEEVGTRGAQTAAHKINPDVALICDVGLAQDVPGGEKGVGVLGKGPMITIYDAGMIPNLALRDFIIEVAEKNKIPYQIQALERGATDGRPIHIHAGGVPCVYLGVATRYIHSHSGIIHAADYENIIKLLTEVVMKLDEKQVRKFSK
ncbi:MAG: M42 family metallopeptidase [Planctomycetes bacterium]|nr:M42 family metallopeptidase [Planctomycetota bacterium]